MLSHDNVFSNAVLGSRRLHLRRADTVLAWLPMSHVFERTAGHFCTWHCGAPRAFAESVDTVPRDMLEVRPTFMAAVPRFYEKVYDATVAAATTASAGARASSVERSRNAAQSLDTSSSVMEHAPATASSTSPHRPALRPGAEPSARGS